MTLAGQRCFCKDCGTQVIVEYEDGPRWTQIGDNAIYEQYRLLEKYGPYPANTGKAIYTENAHYMIWENGICQRCYEKIPLAPEVLQKWQAVWQLDELDEKVRRIVWQYYDVIDSLLQDLSRQWIDSVSLAALDAESFSQIVTDPAIHTKGRIKSLVNSYVQKNLKTIIAAMETECGRQKEPTVSALVTKCNEEIKPLNAAIADLKPRIGYEPFDILCDINRSIARNLNDFVCYEGSIRIPVAVPDTQYYLSYRRALNPNESDTVFESTRNLPAYFHRQEKEFELKLRKIFTEEVRQAVRNPIQ